VHTIAAGLKKKVVDFDAALPATDACGKASPSFRNDGQGPPIGVQKHERWHYCSWVFIRPYPCHLVLLSDCFQPSSHLWKGFGIGNNQAGKASAWVDAPLPWQVPLHQFELGCNELRRISKDG
jgi:hypothetical protein